MSIKIVYLDSGVLIHLAAALSIDAEEFVTTEKTTKPMHRVAEIQVVSIAS